MELAGLGHAGAGRVNRRRSQMRVGMAQEGATEVSVSVPVMILCGGEGTRLREHTEFRPKPMVEIGGLPILWHIMQGYSAHDLNNFVLCLGHMGDVIRKFFLDYHAMVNDFVIRLDQPGGPQILGGAGSMPWTVTCVDTGRYSMTGARVRQALRYIDSDVFCLTYGDGLSDVDIGELIRFHRAHGRIATVTSVAPPSRYGELLVSPDHRVMKFAEKPEEHRTMINGGFMVLDTRRIRPYLEGGDDLILEREPLERLAADGELMARHHHGFWQSMDTYREWRALEALWQSGAAPWATRG